jgi:hypothetical protein
MKTKHTVVKLAVWVGLVALMGCSKEQPAADTQAQGSKATETVKTEASKATEAVKTEATKAADAVKTEATKAVDTVKSTAQDASDKVSSNLQPTGQQDQQQAQGLIDKVKSLIGEQKYQEAMTSLTQLTKLQLTPDQQKIVDGLKTTLQSALAKTTASDAASALGGALGGKQ